MFHASVDTDAFIINCCLHLKQSLFLSLFGCKLNISFNTLQVAHRVILRKNFYYHPILIFSCMKINLIGPNLQKFCKKINLIGPNLGLGGPGSIPGRVKPKIQIGS